MPKYVQSSKNAVDATKECTLTPFFEVWFKSWTMVECIRSSSQNLLPRSPNYILAVDDWYNWHIVVTHKTEHWTSAFNTWNILTIFQPLRSRATDDATTRSSSPPSRLTRSWSLAKSNSDTFLWAREEWVNKGNCPGPGLGLRSCFNFSLHSSAFSSLGFSV